ncbi:MAG: hypothetical protein ACR2NO_08010 [Chloroflexota bacterium]
MPDFLGASTERVSIELLPEELEDLISHVQTGKRLRAGHPRQQRLLAKLRGFGPIRTGEDEEDGGTEHAGTSVCPLERDTPDDVSWLADWVHSRLSELTDGDERAIVWKKAHLMRFLLGRLHDWLEENSYPTAAMTTFQAEALVAHVARYLEHVVACEMEPETEAETEGDARIR